MPFGSARRFVFVALVGAGLGCSDGSDPSGPLQPTDAGAALSCPTHLRFSFLDGNRTDIGWTGATHGSTFSRGAFFRVKVTDCDDECRRCAFEGPVRDDVVNTQRCVSDTAQACTADTDCPNWECRSLVPGNPQSPKVCAHDSSMTCQSAADCGPSACRFFIGPSFPITAPRTCLGTYLDSSDGRPPVFGNIDLQTGAVELTRLGITTGATDSETQGACPKCVGDGSPNDGIQGGTCMQNDVQPAFPYDGNQACDAHGIGQPAEFDGYYSLDCSTPLGVRIDVGLEGGTTNGRRMSLTAVQPECSGGRCWCGVCEGTLDPCHDSGDCLGAACVAPTDVPVRANACIGTCAWDPDAQQGTCMTRTSSTGPLIQVSCFPGEVGSEIVAPGRATVLSATSYSVQLGHVACRQPARAVFMSPVSIATDQAVGLPGPALYLLRFQVDQEVSP